MLLSDELLEARYKKPHLILLVPCVHPTEKRKMGFLYIVRISKGCLEQRIKRYKRVAIPVK
ncbi:hypothetical protein HQ29_04665 [Porphyromonas canoris]|uniref:Uncharacterized protein n=1 Tax=Porphyromonas canoris TaxID=36875 RepID=A0ABR4XJN7_9PORP|nr:hypothetical protein HQ29_04665 [Porphyromonas canoris]KGN70380.1 hypothetical protein JT26_02530 [Porphyromonas sp. COT-108 OH1349]KGN91893.1 hypothetical protein HQ43_07440 [Porphyromonas canoris]KGN95523.1 hypothetical protein HQ39_04480 [Porphyromonas sp. COT-108 OH2963]